MASICCSPPESVPLLQPREERENAFEIAVEAGAVGDDGAHLEVLEHRHAREDAAAFRAERHRHAGDLVRAPPGDVLALVDDTAFAGLRAAEDGHHQRRLAGAVGADQRDDLAGIDGHVDAAKRDDVAVIGLDALDAEEGFAHALTSCTTSSTSSSSTPR
jgi:hypothetical protein